MGWLLSSAGYIYPLNVLLFPWVHNFADIDFVNILQNEKYFIILKPFENTFLFFMKNIYCCNSEITLLFKFYLALFLIVISRIFAIYSVGTHKSLKVIVSSLLYLCILYLFCIDRHLNPYCMTKRKKNEFILVLSKTGRKNFH